MSYELKLEKFSGPLEKLLELIEARQLEITQISMAQVTDDFLKYLKTLSSAKADLRLVADFIAVASRLVLIKSKHLLPDLDLTEDEEAGMNDLERRLKIYKELKPTLKVLAQLWKSGRREFSRPYFLIGGIGAAEGGSGFFYPGKKLGPEELLSAMRNIMDAIETFEINTKTIREKIITIEEKMQEVINRLQGEGRASFKNMSGMKSRSEIIVIFLAILHLAREQLIFLEQSEGFSDIIVRRQMSGDPATEKVRYGESN